MSRSGYSYDLDDEIGTRNLYRANVDRAIKGRRGQAFLREMAAALDAMPVKELISGELVSGGAACAIGSVALARGIDVSGLDPDDGECVAERFGIACALACEIVYENDEGTLLSETPAARWKRMRAWVDEQLTTPEKCDYCGDKAEQMEKKL